MTAKALCLGTVALVVLVAVVSELEMASAQLQSASNFLVDHVRVFDGERVHENTQVAVEGGMFALSGRT
jgi:hypothetical protein